MKPRILLLACASFLLSALPTWADDQPNIVLILVDDMGYTDIGAFSNEIETPNLDSLAEEYGNRTGFERQLHPWVATLPERLGDAGYHTYISGKWHLGLAPDQAPTQRGFDRGCAVPPSGTGSATMTDAWLSRSTSISTWGIPGSMPMTRSTRYQ